MGRIDFLDIIKLCRWFVTVQGPRVRNCSQRFHLVPGVRTRTSNDHFITWTRGGLLKEFRTRPTSQPGGQVAPETMALIRRVHALRLENVEWGEAVVNNENAVLITRMGRRVLSALNTNVVTSQQIIDGVRSALQQLHDIGLAHCDISLSNVYVDDDNAVSLVGLEYLTPVDDPPPHFTRIPQDGRPESALKLDEMQFN